MTQHFIVIGNPIIHSKSPDIHSVFAASAGIDIVYQRQYSPDDNASFVAVIEAFFRGGGVGANVTVPFKQMAYAYCQAHGGLSEHARVAGAVNTLLLKNDDLSSANPSRLTPNTSDTTLNTISLYGDNTDGQGLINHLARLGWSLKNADIAIIGAGGAARGVILPLIEAGIKTLTLANRTPSKADTLIKELSAASQTIGKQTIHTCATPDLTGHFDLIINATSIGLSGATLPLSDKVSCHYAYDMMYGRTLPFLQHFKARGAQVSDGYGMLIGQAALSFERWTGHAVDVTKAAAILDKDEAYR